MQQPPSNELAELPLLTTLKEIAELLVKKHNLHEGIYEVGVQIKTGVGTFGISPDEPAPGAMFTIVGVGLSRVPLLNWRSVDAAEVNPLRAVTKKSRSRK